MNFVPVDTAAPVTSEISPIAVSETAVSLNSKPDPKVAKQAIRTSLRASTVDGVFAAIFTMMTSGILLSNFLVELDATPAVFGLLSSIPMLVNLIQPLGAYLSERITSRYRYSLLINGPARLFWLILVIGIACAVWGDVNKYQLMVLTLVILLASNLLAGLGSASWLSWMATLVPRRLRGRYFGFRNSAASLTNLLCVPLAGLVVSKWPGGSLQGYAVVVLLGIMFGLVSLGCQHFQVDVNPIEHNASLLKCSEKKALSLPVVELTGSTENQPASESCVPESSIAQNKDDSSSEMETVVPESGQNQFGQFILKESNFLKFLLYYGLWMLAVNLSAPFFNLYMLDTLDLDVSWVTLYGSAQAAATLLMLILWGRLADKIGNRRILILVGTLVAITPFLWLGIGNTHLDIWIWLPLLHILTGGTGAAIELCNNNMLLGIAPVRNKSIYFAIAAAVAGGSGALGTTIGGFLAQFANYGGLPGLFAISGVFRLVALLPLLFVQEPRGEIRS